MRIRRKLIDALADLWLWIERLDETKPASKGYGKTLYTELEKRSQLTKTEQWELDCLIRQSGGWGRS